MAETEAKIKDVQLGEELSKRYLSYAMSTIVSRSLPDVRDGLKPVHRRIMYDMYEGGLLYEADFRKSAVLSNFCITIVQNMRKGSAEISDLFTMQAQLYRNERRRIAGKLADEAATLLLIPSTLVLVALIIMLLAPALMEIFNGLQ